MPYQRILDPSLDVAFGENIENVGAAGPGRPIGAPVGYYNSGFSAGSIIRGLGTALSYGGAIAATIPAIEQALGYGKGAAPAQQLQTPAAGPTAHPVLTATPKVAGSGMLGTAIQKVISVVDPAALGGPQAAKKGRYAPPGTKGYHMVKHGPNAGAWVRNRHRNVANIHALRRSLSRIHGFEKICRKVVHFVHPRKATGHAVFKKRRRS